MGQNDEIEPRQVRDAWVKFRETVIPRDASATQLQEMRRAFYAGALSFYMLVMQDDISGADVPEDRGEQVLRALDTELTAFFRNVQAGHM